VQACFDDAVGWVSFMPKLGITSKIMVAPAIIAAMLVVFGLYSARNMWVIESLVDVLNVEAAQERQAQEAESAVHSLQAAAFRSMTLINLNQDKQAQALMSAKFEEVDEFERMLGAGNAPDYLPKLHTYFSQVRDAYDAATSDTNLGAMMLQSATQSYDGLVEELQGVTARSRLAEEKAHRDFDSTLGWMAQVQVLALLAAVLIGMVVAWRVARRISGPLLDIQQTLADIERTGRLSARVDVHTEDEVGATARSVNALLSSMQTGLESVRQTVQALARGDFSVRPQTDLRGDLADMTALLDQTVDSLSHTMSGLSQIMQAMSQGHFSAQIAVHAQGAYQTTADQALATLRSLELMLGDIGRVMQAVAQGQLSVRVSAQGQGDLAQLKENINSSLASLSQAMETINHNARQVASAAAQSSQAIGQISDGAQNQTSAISQVASAVRQTASSVSDVSHNTEQASAKSRQSVAVLRDGLTKIDKMVEMVHNIATHSEKINKITEVIEGIANKTNLLSLNAAIEAARAGEHGKGFAVVADEVGKLAVNSAESSKEIALLVQQAVRDTAQAVDAVQAVSADMSQIERDSQETDDMLQRISRALEEQSTAVEQINANLSNVDAIAQNNASASEEITSTVLELAKLADGMRKEISRFQT
jgi:methyl-accepting chemotaxis protein